MKISVLLALHKESLNVSTRIPSLQGNNRNRTGNRVSQLGNSLAVEDVGRNLTRARLPPKWQLLCSVCGRGSSSCLCYWQSELCCDRCRRDFEQCICNRKGLSFYDWKLKDKNSFTCILSCCKSCSFCRRVATKERCKSRASKINKICERCFLCKSIQFCTKCHKCPTCCTKSACRGRITPVLEKMGSPRRQPQSTSSPQRRLHTSLPAKSDKNSHNNKLLCKPPQEQLPVGGIGSAVGQKCCRVSSKPTIPGVLQPAIFGTQTQQPVETYLGSRQTQQLLENTVIQNGDPRDNKDLPPDRGVGNLHRLQGRVLPHTNKQPVQEVHAFHIQGETYQFKALPFGLSTGLWSLQ